MTKGPLARASTSPGPSYGRVTAMTAVRRATRRVRRVCGRVRHAYDLWYRLGFAWDHAWRIAGTWY